VGRFGSAGELGGHGLTPDMDVLTRLDLRHAEDPAGLQLGLFKCAAGPRVFRAEGENEA